MEFTKVIEFEYIETEYCTLPQKISTK